MPVQTPERIALNGGSRLNHRLVRSTLFRKQYRKHDLGTRIPGVQVQGTTILPLRSRPVPLVEVKDHRQRGMRVSVRLVDRERPACCFSCLGHDGVRRGYAEKGPHGVDHCDTGVCLGVGPATAP